MVRFNSIKVFDNCIGEKASPRAVAEKSINYLPYRSNSLASPTLHIFGARETKIKKFTSVDNIKKFSASTSITGRKVRLI
ncbi:hypothetical protein CCACVL1_22451 [Corchorus capsularis]|uniref:Uncharacterized protein n=1 Tax=Corchorus capsularis TaxID=210143 RepID=A0A1R3GYR3_COCAP|nr:hypothetical protein CCACVL1_22451 [Corchorus capsularis]